MLTFRLSKWKKKFVPALLGIALACGLAPSARAVGTWTHLTNKAPEAISTMLVLLDGRIMAQGNSDRTWYALTPDSSGSYANGTWTQLASMARKRLYYTSAVLRNGDVLIAGGEYSATDNGNVVEDDDNTCEIYHTQTNTWGTVPTPIHRNSSPWTNIGDAVSTTLPSGLVLMGDILSSEQALYDYKTNTWTPSANVKAVRSNEEAWTLQPDGSVLTVDCIGQPVATQNTELYIPASDAWMSAGSTPNQLVDPNSKELGPGLLLANGVTLYIGATGHTALYSGGWVAGPDLYGTSNTLLLGAPDAPGCVEVNGKALVLVSPASTSSNAFPSGEHFLEYTYDATTSHGSFAEAPLPSGGGGFFQNQPSYIGRMLQLPNGQVLFTQALNLQQFVYTPDSAALSSSAPAISNVTARTDGSYLVQGTQFNGVTQGAYYGDDAQMASNYPLVRLTDTSSHVFYGRTYNHSTMGVATGNTPVSTYFVPPATLPQGYYALQVVANGIASYPVLFTEPLGLASLTLTPSTVKGGIPVSGLVTLNGMATSPVNVALSTSNAAVAQPTVTYVTVPTGQTSAPFTISTSAVGTSTLVTIKAIQGRQVRTATLTVTP